MWLIPGCLVDAMRAQHRVRGHGERMEFYNKDSMEWDLSFVGIQPIVTGYAYRGVLASAKMPEYWRDAITPLAQ